MIFANTLYAQNKSVINGKIYDQQQHPLESVSIKILETNQYTSSTGSGSFSVQTTGIIGQEITLEFSCIGFQKQTSKVTILPGKTELEVIRMKILDLSLKEISINARRDYEGSTNSSLIINRDMIEQIPALSINDLLNQIPNRKMAPPSLQNVQNLTLRSTFEEVSSGRDPFSLNNSFGVAIIMDGLAISNNANMQSYNPGITGIGSSGITSGNGYGLSGTRTRAYSGDYAFGGTDLRQIPVENIESIEVISGVPSAKYGDLTDGAVIIERQAGKSPAQLTMQLRDNATSYGLSKGFKLPDHLGALNLGLNYVNSYADNRDKIKAFRRITGNAMWTNTFGKQNQFKNTFSLDYGQNLDGIRQDPDDPNKTKVRFDSWNFSVGNRSSYPLSGDFLKNIALNLRYAEGHQTTYREELVNKAYIMYSDATTTGITEGEYATGIYNAISQIDGRPINMSAALDFNAELNTGSLVHYVSFGGSFNYSMNKGQGQMSDPSRPRTLANTSTRPNGSERYYDFALAHPQQDFGAYVEDFFKFKVFERDLNIRAGLRLDQQNGFTSFSPRTNVNYQVTKNLRMGLAYGLSLKAPGLAHRYPGPTFIEVPLVNAYNGNANESTYLLYIERYDPTNKNIKPSQNQSMEFTTQVKFGDFNLSFSAFHKMARNGISSIQTKKMVELPKYLATAVPGQKPLITEIGTTRYLLDYYTIGNILRSNSQGLEIILNTPQIKQISTSFNLSGGIFKTKYKTTGVSFSNPNDVSNTVPDYAKIGIYWPGDRTSYLSNARVTTNTHIPEISLIVQFTAEFSLLEKTIRSSSAGIPIAYYTNDSRYVTIENFDYNNPAYNYLYKPISEINSDNMPRVIANYHLSIGKEIKKRFKFSFNVYNFFNHQPTYINTGGTTIYPNPAPTFGAQISLKL